MKKLFFILFTTIAGLSFAQEAKMNPETEEFIWRKNQLLYFNYAQDDSNQFNPELKSGDNWFFQYTHRSAESPEVSDDEMTQTIGFMIKPTKKKCFKISDKQLNEANTYYMMGCFCLERGFHKVNQGSIHFKKLKNNQWQVTMKLTIHTRQNDRVVAINKVKKRFILES